MNKDQVTGFSIVAVTLAVCLILGLDSDYSASDLSIVSESASQTVSKDSGSKDCSYNGIELKGNVQFVDSFPDIKIKYVSSFADIDVQFVSSFPDNCGQWKEVTSFPDFTVQVVDSFPDLEVRKVSSFPGMN